MIVMIGLKNAIYKNCTVTAYTGGNIQIKQFKVVIRLCQMTQKLYPRAEKYQKSL
jgi:hypothetical protein